MEKFYLDLKLKMKNSTLFRPLRISVYHKLQMLYHMWMSQGKHPWSNNFQH